MTHSTITFKHISNDIDDKLITTTLSTSSNDNEIDNNLSSTTSSTSLNDNESNDNYTSTTTNLTKDFGLLSITPSTDNHAHAHPSIVTSANNPNQHQH